MKNVTSNFKEDIRTYGRQIDCKIKINDENIDIDNINYIKPSFNACLFKTIMHKIEIDSKMDISKKTKINIQAGIKLNETNYEYINYNTYFVNSSERQEDTISYIIVAYDKMIESMIDYDLKIYEEISLREYLIEVCNRLGWNTDNIPTIFINSTKMVNPVLHQNIGYTFRDVLDEIATLSCSNLLFKGEDFYLIYPNKTGEEIDETYLDEDNINIGEKYFINSLVFSRVENSDNIYRQDEASIHLNGLHEYKISDNQLLSNNDRDLYIDDMFNYLKTLEFYIFDIKSKGILFFEACDMFNLNLSNKIYPIILLNNEIQFEDGLSESMYLDKPDETETEYKYADTTDKKINQTYIVVDKQNQIIKGVVNNVTEQNEKIAQITLTVNELNSKISDVADLTTSTESNKAVVSLEKINKSEPIYIRIYPLIEHISYLYPNSELYPSNNLFGEIRILRFTNKDTKEIIDYELPDDLLYCEGTYDEFILDYNSQSCTITKRVEYKSDGTVYVLDNPITTEYDYPKIELEDGDYMVELLGYSNAYIFVRMMSQNIYTTQFATKSEVNSEIKQTADSINLEVNKKLTNYVTDTEMNSVLSINTENITSEVSKRYSTKSETALAKNEAINQANKDTDNKLINYATTSEMNSKVEQTAESITQNVSSVENKVQKAQNTADNINKNLSTNYYTKTETNSQIQQKADSITSTVSKTYSTKTETTNAKTEAINSANYNTNTKLKDYSTTTQMNSTIQQTAENISREVSKKVGNDEIISKINQSAEQIDIDANKISLKR